MINISNSLNKSRRERNRAERSKYEDKRMLYRYEYECSDVKTYFMTEEEFNNSRKQRWNHSKTFKENKFE